MPWWYPLVLLLALTMQGEVEVLHSDSAALAVGEVAMNRALATHEGVDNGAFRRELLYGFNGWRRIRLSELDPRYVDLARDFLGGKHEWDHNARFMLSSNDCVWLRADTSKAVKSFKRGIWSVYLFEEWPK